MNPHTPNQPIAPVNPVRPHKQQPETSAQAGVARNLFGIFQTENATRNLGQSFYVEARAAATAAAVRR